MLRYPADIRSIGFLSLYALLVIGQWLVAPAGPLGWLLVAFTSIVSFICAVIAHNTVHCPAFKQRWANKLFQVWVSLSYGFPISDYVPGHNLSHHRFTQLREDVMRTSHVRSSWNLLNILLFMPKVTPGILRGNAQFKAVMGDRAAPWKRQLLLEAIVVWSVKVAAFAIDWQKALLYVLVPHLFANWAIVSVNYLWHDGCDPDHRANHSRNFVGTFFNWCMLNNGYHGMHHMKPGLHWSLLPAAHAEQVAPYIHPALEQRSFALYLWTTFVYPGKRVRFDGAPVVIGDEGPDRDWVQPTDVVPDY